MSMFRVFQADDGWIVVPDMIWDWIRQIKSDNLTRTQNLDRSVVDSLHDEIERIEKSFLRHRKILATSTIQKELVFNPLDVDQFEQSYQNWKITRNEICSEYGLAGDKEGVIPVNRKDLYRVVSQFLFVGIRSKKAAESLKNEWMGFYFPMEQLTEIFDEDQIFFRDSTAVSCETAILCLTERYCPYSKRKEFSRERPKSGDETFLNSQSYRSAKRACDEVTKEVCSELSQRFPEIETKTR